MFAHGAQTALGWFGGWGFRGTIAHFEKSGLPVAVALLTMAAEFLGPIAQSTPQRVVSMMTEFYKPVF